MQHYAAAQFEVYVDAGWGSIRDALSIRQCANRSSFDASGFDEAGGGVIRCCAIPHTQTTTPGAKGRFAYVLFMTVGFDRLTASYLLLHALAPERFFLCAASWLCWCVHGFPFLIGVRGLCRADLRIYRTPRCYRLQIKRLLVDVHQYAGARGGRSAFNALNDKHKEHPLGDTIGSRVLGWLTVRY